MVSYPIFDYYYTQIIGNPNDMPVIKGTSGFQGGYLIDSDPYFTANLNWPSTVVFFRQIRNIVLDLRDIPADNTVSGIHWPTAQATSLQNMVFETSSSPGTKHQGIFCESGQYSQVSQIPYTCIRSDLHRLRGIYGRPRVQRG